MKSLKQILFYDNLEITDALLVKIYIEGDSDALSILIKRHRSKVCRFIYSKIGDRTITGDIFQDIFVKVVKNLKSNIYNEEGKFISWAKRISHNLIFDHFRNNKRTII